MRIATPIASLLVLSTLMGCGSEQPTAPESVATTATSSTPQEPTYEILTEAALEDALLGIDQLPTGYSQDPPSADEGNKYFCDYTPPAEEKFRVRRDFTKGGGMTAELASVTLRQFTSASEASAAWDAMTETLKTCKSEIFEGTELTYSPLSAPQLGDASAGLKVDADGVTLLQNFVLVGPVMISSGGGGFMDVDADAIADLLEVQVAQYVDAAKN